MSEQDLQYLDVFATWLKRLPEDVLALAEVLALEDAPEPCRLTAAGALNHVLKSADLLTDGIEDLAYLEDVFVLRAAARSVREAGLDVLAELSAEATLVDEFLGDEAPRLARSVQSLSEQSARGRSAREASEDAEQRSALIDDVKAWAGRYAVPTLSRNAKSLVKLRAFLRAKLPQ